MASKLTARFLLPIATLVATRERATQNWRAASNAIFSPARSSLSQTMDLHVLGLRDCLCDPPGNSADRTSRCAGRQYQSGRAKWQHRPR